MKLAFVVCLCTLSAFAQEVVFRGVPTVRVFTTVEREDRQSLDAEAAQKSACIIIQRGKKYFWASRDNAEMIRTDAPNFTYFVHAGGSGYVKVLTGSRTATKAPADYIEHVTRGFETITYWGKVQ